MGTDQPEIVADLSLLPMDAGGKTKPITVGEYRGVLGVGSEHHSFRCFIPAGGELAPGGTIRCGIQFLFPEAALLYFPVGAEFTVWEGRIVGRGRVLEVLRSKGEAR